MFISLHLSIKSLYPQADITLRFALKRLSTCFSFPKAQVFKKSFKRAHHNSWTILFILHRFVCWNVGVNWCDFKVQCKVRGIRFCLSDRGLFYDPFLLVFGLNFHLLNIAFYFHRYLQKFTRWDVGLRMKPRIVSFCSLNANSIFKIELNHEGVVATVKVGGSRGINEKKKKTSSEPKIALHLIHDCFCRKPSVRIVIITW